MRTIRFWIGSHLVAAATVHRRALRRSRARIRLLEDLGLAYRHERQAADLLGNAPGKPAITELQIPLTLFGAFDLALGQDGQSLWVSGSDASRILLYPSLEPGAQPLVFKLRPGSYPHGVVVGPDAALYVAETGTNIGGNAIARLTASGDRHEFLLPAGLVGGPWGIAVGPDRKIWFTEVGAGTIGRVDPVTGKLVEYRLPTAYSQPQAIVSGPGGALWGTEADGNRIFRVTADGHATEFRIPTPRSVPVSIAAGRGGFFATA